MPAQPLVRQDDSRAKSASRRPLIGGIVALVLLAALAAGAWWYFTMRERPPAWDRVPDLALAAPAGDPLSDESPWVTLQLAPARSDHANNVRVALIWPQGTPVAAAAPQPHITAVTATRVGGDNQPETLALTAEPTAANAQTATVTLSSNGWWRIGVDVDGTQRAAEFYLLIPDPNVNGPTAVAANSSSAEGEALFQHGLIGITSLQNLRYTQWLADGHGNAGISEHAVSAGGDGTPPGFTYRAPGGMEAVVIGTTRWVKLPGELGWTEQEGAISVPPSQWGEEYAGATQFTILGEETIDGAQTQILSFLVPELSEPQRRSAAWYLWWVDSESGRVRKEAMVSRVHYMLNNFGDFDVPIALAPPPETGTPAAGTPIP